MNITAIQLIIEILILLFSLYLIFFKSYFKEKGRQLAVKEDIEEITSKVEGIKNNFISQNELLKANLQITNSNIINVNAKKQSYLLDYFANYSVWKTAVFNASPTQISENVKRSEISFGLDKLKIDFEVISRKVELFFDDEIYYELCADLTVNIINYQSILEQYLIKAEITEYEKKLNEDEPVLEKKIERINELQNELISFAKTLAEIKKEYLINLIPIERKMKKYLLSQLKEMNNGKKTNALNVV